jgi:hypothetical protein
MWTVAKLNRDNTGGSEGVLLLKTEEFKDKTDLHKEFTSGHYSKKMYKLHNKVPWMVRKVVPKGKLELYEESWNAYPYSKSIINVSHLSASLNFLNQNLSLILKTS